jgi:hypothetical protein
MMMCIDHAMYMLKIYELYPLRLLRCFIYIHVDLDFC